MYFNAHMKNMPPRISVIIPVYNGEKYLQETLESIFHQTFSDFELLVIDDASSDGSLKLVKEFALKDPRVKMFVNDQNMGISFSTNFGIDHAQGEFIALTDQDDISLPTRFEDQIQFLETHPEIDVLGTQVTLINDQNEKQGDESPLPLTPGLIRWGLIFGCMLSNSSVMFRRKVFDESEFRFGNFKAAQDYDLFTRLSLNCQMANLPKILLNSRRHADNLSRTSADLQRQETYEIVRFHVKTIINEELTDYIISGILFAKHQKITSEIASIKIAQRVSRILSRLVNSTSTWKITKEDRRQIKQNAASRLRRIWKEHHFHPSLIPFALYSLILDPDLLRRKIGLKRQQTR